MVLGLFGPLIRYKIAEWQRYINLINRRAKIFKNTLLELEKRKNDYLEILFMLYRYCFKEKVNRIFLIQISLNLVK